ncbi:hypothetical protein PoB_000107800 [Plakobranchus ocellatus]|uniref:Uncharacterized protein n=1 Tax=Plakobranchus ocellatus TaxID=259542 RepID=A0AAV3XX58_9GAST|nr:hypothetical protein PoB_000107800 [Plakobranchus ocellatus]
METIYDWFGLVCITRPQEGDLRLSDLLRAKALGSNSQKKSLSKDQGWFASKSATNAPQNNTTRRITSEKSEKRSEGSRRRDIETICEERLVRYPENF